MAEQERYTLVFKGELVKGASLDTTKANIGNLFKIGADKIEPLFSGRPVTLKKDLSLDAANRYRVAIKKAGARVDMVLQANTSIKNEGIAVAEKKSPTVSVDVSPQKNSVPLVEVSGERVGSGLTLAPAGADLLASNEKKSVPTKDVDVSALTVREQSGNLLDESEYVVSEAPLVDVSQFNLAEVGADLLRPEEKPVIAIVNVDVDNFSLAEPGAKLGPDLPVAPPAPDVSELSLMVEK